MPFPRLRWMSALPLPRRNLLSLFSVCAHRDSLHEVIVREILRALLDSLPLTALVSEVGRQFLPLRLEGSAFLRELVHL